MTLTNRIRAGQGDFVLFALTPPRQSTPADQLPEIAAATIERLRGLDLDGLVLYDIDDESSRNPAERPAPMPIVFTFSVCGSMKTLEFLRWLGVDVPRWIENDLRHSENPLQASRDQAFATAVEITDFCRRLGVPFGLNIESVSIRREEIEAAVELAAEVTAHLQAGASPAVRDA